MRCARPPCRAAAPLEAHDIIAVRPLQNPHRPHSYHNQAGKWVSFLALRSAGHYMLQRGWGGRQCGHPPRACRGAHA